MIFSRYTDHVTDSPTQLADAPVAMPTAFHSRMGLLLVRIGDDVAARGQHALEAIGISGRDYSALAVISADKPRSQLELARMMGKAPALCVALLDDLESAGLVTRGRDPEDRRRSVVTLTDAGEAMLTRADAVAEEVTAATLDGLSPEDLAQFTALAQRAMPRTSTLYCAD